MKYDQATGSLTMKSGKVYKGYSGHGIGLNNPSAQDMRGVGPLPRGKWKLTAWVDHPHLGRMVTHLLPISVKTDRSAFFMHGDNQQMNHTASDGCLIFSYEIRKAIRDSGETELEVV